MNFHFDPKSNPLSELCKHFRVWQTLEWTLFSSPNVGAMDRLGQNMHSSVDPMSHSRIETIEMYCEKYENKHSVNYVDWNIPRQTQSIIQPRVLSSLLGFELFILMKPILILSEFLNE